MSTLLQPQSTEDVAASLTSVLHEQVTDWADAEHVASTAAAVLSGRLRRPVVSVHRFDSTSGELTLLGISPSRPGDLPLGSRHPIDQSPIGLAVSEGENQRALNQYVNADFVRSLPGETRSTLAVPIRAGDRSLGVIQLEYASPSTPSAEDERATGEIADCLAIAYGAASAIASKGTSAGSGESTASSLDSLTSALARADDLDETLARTPVVAAEAMSATGAVLLLKHSDRQMLDVVAAHGSLDSLANGLVPLDGTWIGQIFRKGAATSISGDSEGDPLFPAELLPRAVSNGLAVPVTTGGKCAGILLATDSPDGFDASSVQQLQRIADVAGALAALRSIGPLRQRISDAALIAEVGRAMTGTLGLDEVLALVVRSAEMLVSGRSAGVAMLNEDGSRLTLAAASGSLMTKTNTEFETTESVVGWVAASGEILLTADLSNDVRGWPHGENYGPAALVPLESRGQIRGVLFAARKSGADELTDHDLDAVRKLAAYGAIAIENARLYREQTELSETLKLQARELEKAYAELNTSQERLLVSEKMAALGRVTAGIAHEINSPLGSILNCLQLATTYTQEYGESVGDPDVTADDHAAIAKDILDSLKLAEEAARRVAQFVRSIKSQTRMEEEQVEEFEAKDVAESTILMLEHELKERPVQIEAKLDPEINLRGDPNKFAVIVQNLATNAIDAYGVEGGTVQIELERDGSNTVLRVTDTGSGIPDEIRPRIYDYLFTTKDVGSGTGLGLSLVHSIVTSHFRGKIDFQTEVGSGTTFVVTIPEPDESNHGA